MSREEKIARTFVHLADSLVDDYDVIDLLQHLTLSCRDLLDATDVAVLLAYPGPDLYSPVPCDPSPALAAVLDPAARQGPAVDACRTAAAVAPGPLATAPAAWRDFTEAARRTGYTHAAAVPVRLRRDTLGSLLLLSTGDGPLPPADLRLAQAFADATALGLLNARPAGRPHTISEQLHDALHSRIVIEQAKGFLAERDSLSADDAFAALRDHARRHGVPLTEVARTVVTTGRLRPPTATGN
ncbi:ANTAR domain-containing protein [Streptomyces fumanus]|uniref:Transcriptional regulator n=1 Tax=Streptomyces fumanus TaxID=67302 RepID=A0A919E091_9ACTN|nr:ANTAR domain-containing protein [Streptomyces fumanus]GHE96719.1 transcriptional regulator [Streptomyces fumanus]